MSEPLQPKADEAWAFSQFIAADGPYYLERMNSEGPPSPVAKTYPASDPASFKKFVEANNGPELRRNLYFLPNAKFLSGKRRKDNLSHALFLHADLDCKDYPGALDEQQSRIIGLLLEPKERPKGVPEPTAVWFTGGGIKRSGNLTSRSRLASRRITTRGFWSPCKAVPARTTPTVSCACLEL